MKIKFSFTPGTKVEPVRSEEGEIIGFSAEPFFPSRRAASVLAHGTSFDVRDRVLDQFILVVSATNGAVANRKRNQAVKPLVDMSEEERASIKEEAEEEA